MAVGPRRSRVLLRTLLPWVVALALIAFVLDRVPLSAAWQAVERANMTRFAAIVAAGTLVWFALESYAYSVVLSACNAPVRWREARTLRGFSYLLTPVHWNLGKAAVVFRLRSTRGFPLLETTSTFLLYQTLSMLVLAVLAAVGLAWLMLQAPSFAGSAASRIAALATLIGVAVALLASLALARSKRVDRLLADRRFGRLRIRDLFHAHRSARPRDLGAVIALKGSYHLVYVLFFYFGLASFGVEIPLALALAATPIIQAVGGLPLTPAGLGTQQAAMLYFLTGRFGGHGGEAEVVAFGFSFPVALLLSRGLLGLFYLSDLRSADSSAREPST